MKSFLTFISEADGNPSPNKAGNPVSKPEVKKPAEDKPSKLLNPKPDSVSARVARTKNLTEDSLEESEDFIKTLERMSQSGGEMAFRNGQRATVPSEYIRKAIAMFNQLGDRGEKLAFSKRLRASPGDFKSAIKFTGN
jgi:hypothetical protein